MGEVADDIIDGSVCGNCGQWFDDVINGASPPGYPRSCCCEDDEDFEEDEENF